jgi:hypothetical protein
MSLLETIDIKNWDDLINDELRNKAVAALEEGRVLYFPLLDFSLSDTEQTFLTPAALHPKSKNISYNGLTDTLNGSTYDDPTLLKAMIRRYSENSRHLLERLLPAYSSCLAAGKTSFRPVEIAGRKTSYRKDDTRLHVDAFPSNPTRGVRILRVFTNINRSGAPRLWRLGEPLPQIFSKFLPSIPAPWPGMSSLLKWIGITKDYRTPYDHYMLHVHDAMKGDDVYQKTCPQEAFPFPPGCSWMVFTDQVAHAAMSGQHVLEQTFHVPLNSLVYPQFAPLSLMEKMLGKPLGPL